MQVFKAFAKIAGKKKFSALLYIGIFMIISILMANQSAKDNNFKETKLSICIIDMDNTAASQKLVDYISSNHNIQDIDTDKDTILDYLYYQSTDYVLTIKEGYSDKISAGEVDDLFSNYKVSGTYSTALFESQLDQYVTNLSCYIAGGFSIDDAISKTAQTSNSEIKVKTENFSDSGSFNSEYIYYYFQYLPFIFIAILISCLCPALLTINKKEIRSRTNCSPVSTTKQTFQITLGAIIYAVIIWLIFMIAALILCGKMLLCREGLLAVLNSLVFMLVVLSMTLLISVLAPSPKATDMIANTIGLGMSFLCGVFVPQKFLGEAVINVAHFLPAYWFIRANNMLAGISDELFSSSKYFSYLGIELLFAVAIFSVVLLVAKTKIRSSSN